MVSWAWSFGDGATPTAQNLSRTYASAETYSVTLMVTDNDGATNSTSQSVTVTAPVTNQCERWHDRLQLDRNGPEGQEATERVFLPVTDTNCIMWHVTNIWESGSYQTYDGLGFDEGTLAPADAMWVRAHSSTYLSILFTNPLFDTVDWGYTRDYRKLTNRQADEWPFVVRASSGVGEVTLSWQGDAAFNKLSPYPRTYSGGINKSNLLENFFQWVALSARGRFDAKECR